MFLRVLQNPCCWRCCSRKGTSILSLGNQAGMVGWVFRRLFYLQTDINHGALWWDFYFFFFPLCAGTFLKSCKKWAALNKPSYKPVFFSGSWDRGIWKHMQAPHQVYGSVASCHGAKAAWWATAKVSCYSFASLLLDGKVKLTGDVFYLAAGAG